MSDFDIKDKRHKIDPCYGLETREITDEDIEALKSGKRLYTTINGDEYALLITYRKEK